MNLMFLLVLVIFAGYAFWGMKIGLMKMGFRFVSAILIVLLSTAATPIFTHALMENKKVYDYVEKNVEVLVQKYRGMNEKEEKEEKEAKEKKKEESSLNKMREKFSSEVTKKVAVPYLTATILRTFSFLSIYLILTLILFALEKIFCLIAKLPVLNSLNRLAGGAVGLAKGLLAVWLLFMLLTVFMDKPLAGEGLKQIGENEWLRYLYDNNLIARFIEQLTS